MLHLHALFVLALQETTTTETTSVPWLFRSPKEWPIGLGRGQAYRMIPPGNFSGLRKIKVRQIQQCRANIVP
jgi:hypothetical protein